jgi:hypothetical protein
MERTSAFLGDGQALPTKRGRSRLIKRTSDRLTKLSDIPTRSPTKVQTDDAGPCLAAVRRGCDNLVPTVSQMRGRVACTMRRNVLIPIGSF